jgi:hypothetical protein
MEMSCIWGENFLNSWRQHDVQRNNIENLCNDELMTAISWATMHRVCDTK